MLDLLHSCQHSFLATAKSYFGEIGEIAAICVVGFIPTFFVLAILLFVLSKIVSGKLNKFHWIVTVILSAVLSPLVGTALTFVG